MSKQYPTARQNPALHAAPTFRPVQRGRRRKGLQRRYQGKLGTLDILMFWELDVADQTLLYTILAMARAEERGSTLHQETDDEIGREAWEKLELKGHKMSMSPSLMLRTTPYELLHEMGRKSDGRNYQWLQDSLKRLSNVSFEYSGRYWIGGFHMMSRSMDRETEELVIGINPVTAHSIMKDNQGYTMVHMQERDALNTDAAKALHAVLAGLVSPGSKSTFKADTLSARVWADYDDEVPDGAIRKRRGWVQRAAEEIGALDGWRVEQTGKGQKMAFTVARKRYFTKGRVAEET